MQTFDGCRSLKPLRSGISAFTFPLLAFPPRFLLSAFHFLLFRFVKEQAPERLNVAILPCVLGIL
jgi:hypothetical protein